MHMLPAMNAGGRILTPYQGARAKGWPDIFAVRGDRAVAMELKCGKNRLSSEQTSWLADLRAAGVETYIVYDVDWMAGRLDDVLK
jgi:Holliday junction resolvase